MSGVSFADARRVLSASMSISFPPQPQVALWEAASDGAALAVGCAHGTVRLYG